MHHSITGTGLTLLQYYYYVILWRICLFERNINVKNRGKTNKTRNLALVCTRLIPVDTRYGFYALGNSSFCGGRLAFTCQRDLGLGVTPFTGFGISLTLWDVIYAGTGCTGFCAGLVCAPTGYICFTFPWRGNGIYACLRGTRLCGSGISDLSHGHGIILNPAQNRRKNPEACT